MAKNPKLTEHILKTASELFYEVGFSQVSMEQIARAAGVSKATLYSHFEHKAALFQAAVEAATERFILEMDRPDLRELGVRQALMAVARYYLQFMLRPENLAVVRAIIAEVTRQPEFGQQFYQAGPARGLAGLERFLKSRQDSGELPPGDSSAGARHLIALARGDLYWRALFGVPVSEAEVEACVDGAVRQFLQGFGNAGAIAG